MVNAALVSKLPLGSERCTLALAACFADDFGRAVALGISAASFTGNRSTIWTTLQRHYEAYPGVPPGYTALRDLLPDRALEELKEVANAFEGGIDGHVRDVDGFAAVLLESQRENTRYRETMRAIEELERGNLDNADQHFERARELSQGVRPKTPFDRPLETLAEDWLTEPPPARTWLLKDREGDGLLPLGKVGAMIAAGGVGKTMALAQLAISVAAGIDWLGAFRVSAPGMVLLALGEEDLPEIRRRVYNAAQALDLTGDQRAIAASRIVPFALSGEDVRLTDELGNRTPNFRALRERLDARSDWRLIVLDPLSRFAGADTENDNSVATRFVEALEALTTAPGNPTVLVAHHTSKMARSGMAGPMGSSASRGVTGLTDGVRWVCTIESGEPGRATFSVVKTNYSREIEPVALRRLEGGALQAMTVGETAERDAEQVAKHEERCCERVLWIVRKHPGKGRDEISKLVKMKKADSNHALDLLRDAGQVDEIVEAKGKKTYRFRAQQALPQGAE
jgi:hypothetical protein